MAIILVAGGAGFLGSQLCMSLIDEGHTVICYDNLSTGRLNNVSVLLEHDRFHYVNGDIQTIHPGEVGLSMYSKIDQIYNLACPASPPKYQADPIGTFMTSIIGTQRLLEMAKHFNIPMLHASTSEVYGDPNITPQPEGYRGNVNCAGIRSCYDEGKRGAETLCFEYLNQHNVDVRLVRIFHTYGPRLDPADGRVISNFIKQALKDEDITVYGDGTQTRSLCFVSDTVQALMNLMAAERANLQSDLVASHKGLMRPSLPGQAPVPYQTLPIFNVGNPNEMTIMALAEMIKSLVPGCTSNIVKMPLPGDDPMQRCPDITKIQGVLGWQPQVTLDEGLKTTIQYYREVELNAEVQAQLQPLIVEFMQNQQLRNAGRRLREYQYDSCSESPHSFLPMRLHTQEVDDAPRSGAFKLDESKKDSGSSSKNKTYTPC